MLVSKQFLVPAGFHCMNKEKKERQEKPTGTFLKHLFFFFFFFFFGVRVFHCLKQLDLELFLELLSLERMFLLLGGDTFYSHEGRGLRPSATIWSEIFVLIVWRCDSNISFFCCWANSLLHVFLMAERCSDSIWRCLLTNVCSLM